MSKELLLSLKEEPVDLFESKQYKNLLDYAEVNKKYLNNYWQNKNSEEIELFIKYALSKLSFFNKFVEKQEQLYSIFRVGELLGAVESYANILYEKQYDQLTVNRIREERHTIKYLDDIVKLLECFGGLTHAELCEHLSLKASTLSEAIKKVLATGVIDFRSSGKYKIYSLTDAGIRYGRFIRNQNQQIVSNEQVIMILKQSIENSASQQVLDEFRDRIAEILGLKDISIKKNQKVRLLIENPKTIEIKDIEINKIENNVNGKTQIYCKWEEENFVKNNSNETFHPIFLRFVTDKDKEKILNYA